MPPPLAVPVAVPEAAPETTPAPAAAADVVIVDGLVANLRALMDSPAAVAEADAWASSGGGGGRAALAALYEQVVQLQKVRGGGGVREEQPRLLFFDAFEGWGASWGSDGCLGWLCRPLGLILLLFRGHGRAVVTEWIISSFFSFPTAAPLFLLFHVLPFTPPIINR